MKKKIVILKNMPICAWYKDVKSANTMSSSRSVSGIEYNHVVLLLKCWKKFQKIHPEISFDEYWDIWKLSLNDNAVGIGYECLKNLKENWQKYKKEHLEISFEIDFNIWQGTTLINDSKTLQNYTKFSGLSAPFYLFDNEEIQEIKKSIDTFIDANEILGLIVEPFLTLTDLNSELVNMNTFEDLYNYFEGKVPIYYLNHMKRGTEAIPSEEFSIIEKMTKEYEKKGYKNDPCLRLSDMDAYGLFSKEMFDYFIDFYEKKNETLKLERIK